MEGLSKDRSFQFSWPSLALSLETTAQSSLDPPPPLSLQKLSFSQVASSQIWTILNGNGKSVILGNLLVDMRSEVLKKWLVGNLSPTSIDISSVEDWISDWGCNGTFTVNKIDSFQALISFEMEEEGSWLLKEFPVLHDSPFSSLAFWSVGMDSRSVWIRVSGIPVRAWFPEALNAIGAFLGRVLEVEPFTSSGRHFHFAIYRVV